MSDIVNLRQFKKQKARAEKQKQADRNRIQFGRTKTEKAFAHTEATKAERFLDQNRLENSKKPDETK
ncbi:DUF4169 family protein [Brucella oryzae]|uniref:DUF4169 domain-containing protein n=1 Tax=Brucella oryzae TaxID=335286 RepID=A0A2S7IZE5_9HYPH|nr:DUF4169 family protein [Brucella oryzae]MBR7651343.1 DUF4169 family protein [Brucella oryzae]PQA73384.1 DUF4169 domain-containing protein [Brucella oryzae]